MTVPAALTTYRYEGNGVTTVFAYSNRLLTTADVKVQILTRATDEIVETLALTTDYTVTLVSNSLANITIVNAAKIPSVTQDILLSLDIDISQTRSYPRADSLPAADIEKGLDKLTLISQLNNDGQIRSLRFPASDTSTNGELPPKAERALTYLAFDSDGVPIASAAAVGGAPAGAFGATLVATATQAEAQTLLDIPDAIPFTPASSASAASMRFAEDTDNGTNYLDLAAPSSLSFSAGCLLPFAGGTLVAEDNNVTLSNKTLASPVINGDITGTAFRIVQRVRTQTGAVATGTTLMNIDDTIPQITEGTEFMTLAITPKNAANILDIDVTFVCSTATVNQVIAALFQDSTANALAATATYIAANTAMACVRVRHQMAAGTTSATTFRLRAGATSADTLTFNGQAGSRRLGGISLSSITITEYSA